MSAAGAEALASSPYLRNLTVLSLQETELGDCGVETLLRSPNLQGLLDLDLNWNEIKTGIAPLTDRTILPRLVHYSLDGNDIEPSLAAAIRKRFGG